MGRKSGGRKGAAGGAGGGGAGRQIDVLGNPSTTAINEVNAAIRSIPEKIWKKLDQAGVKMVLGGKLEDVDPQLANMQPRGWPAGSTWKEVGGGFNTYTKRGWMVESVQDSSGRAFKRTGYIGGTFKHETGHAFDSALGKASEKEAFMKAYNSDVAKIPNSSRDRYSYFLQGGNAGPSEAFAELFNQHHGLSPGRQDVISVFPKAYKVLKGLMR